MENIESTVEIEESTLPKKRHGNNTAKSKVKGRIMFNARLEVVQENLEALDVPNTWLGLKKLPLNSELLNEAQIRGLDRLKENKLIS